MGWVCSAPAPLELARSPAALCPHPDAPPPSWPAPQVKGATDTLGLLRLLRPKAYIPLMNAELDQSGPLADMLVEEGGIEQVAAQLKAAGAELAGVRVCVPQPTQPMALEL